MLANYKFDYIRLVVRNRIRQEVDEFVDTLHTAYLREGGSAAAWRTSYLPENISNPSGTTVDVWGYDADILITRCMKVEDFVYASRIDVRTELGAEKVFQTVAEKLAVNFAFRAGRQTFVWTNSPVRIKKLGRDAGGMGFRAGGYTSRRCMKLYKRGREGWAIEGTLQYDVLMNIIGDAATRYVSQDKPKLPFAAILLSEFNAQMREWAQRVLGLTLRGSYLLFPMSTESENQQAYEKLLQGIEGLDPLIIDPGFLKGNRQKPIFSSGETDDEYQDKIS